MNYVHSPVLVEEVLTYLVGENDKLFLDCTIGEGGHSEAVLNRYKDIVVYGVDRDPEILSSARSR
ncbi:MAG TPA: 16S rRNA (cytosine(1402)-N(4))-methyltransferase, partial [Spirochaetota bacterium]|nr:16S rRNA (cytosine(1402)-N(4))-methyltransferase [Spirochaetota bacterium]